jgi:hypothetical protein
LELGGGPAALLAQSNIKNVELLSGGAQATVS